MARVREAFPSLVISVDTWRASVGDAVCAAGADLLNDAWGGADPELVDVAAAHGAAIVCTHTGGVTPRTRPYRIEYDDVVRAAIDDTVAYAERALAAGVARESIVIDPAHDFGKNTFHSLELTRRLGEMVDTGWPVLVSLSNKDFVGETLDLPGRRAAHRHPRRHRGLRAGRRPHLPRPRGRRDPADRRHGQHHRRPAAAAARDPGAPVTRVVLVPGVLALLPEYAGIEDPVAELRAAALDAVAWLGPEVTVLADAQGARVAAYLLEATDRGGDEPSYLVVGNGSAMRTEKAPGHFDERAEAFDAALGASLRAGRSGGRRRPGPRAVGQRGRDRRAGRAGRRAGRGRRSTTRTRRTACSTGWCGGRS